MEKDRKKSDECCPKPSGEKKSGGQETGSEEACRCKEVSKKSFSGLLKIMLDDFAFWRNKK
ncbi:MAG: hypothetical protein EPN94_08950 [Nitrospirae bacterium]|nr:MAG: hypothetical protein EPN94_08950 [Nitrospirota bacterium]